MSREVNARKLAAMVGGLVAIYVLVLVTGWSIPDQLLGLVGGQTGVGRRGGVVAKVRDTNGATTTVAIAGVSEGGARNAVDVLEGGGLEFHIVRTSNYAYDVGDLSAFGVKAEIEQWSPESGGPHRTMSYLYAPRREDLEAAIADARARGVLRLPADSVIGFEQIRTNERTHGMWRTYELAANVELDASMIDAAMGSYDPNTNRPTILVDFTREGATRFADLTERIVGDKLAMVIGERVYSAPVINSRITGGRAAIAMGAGDPTEIEAERDALVTVLRQPRRPVGTVVDRHWQPPATGQAVYVWLVGLAIGVVAGIITAVLAFVVIRVARPRWRTPPPVVAGAFPWKRLAVTLLAPLAMFVLPRVTLPGVNDVELRHVIATGGRSWFDTTSFSVIAMGIVPLLSAFGLVELVALAVPRLRWRRHDPRGRIALGKATAIVGFVLALVQAFFIATYVEALSRGGAEIVEGPGWRFRLMAMASLGAGTALLSIIAGLIREHGLGNGYGALMASAPIVIFFDGVLQDASVIVDGYGGLVGVGVIAAATAIVLRWRIGGGERQPELRVPSSGFEALSPLGGIGYIVVTLSGLGLGYALLDVASRVTAFEYRTWVIYGSLLVFVPLWSWILARPSLVTRVALQAGMERPGLGAWGRATFVSLALAAFVFVAAMLARETSSSAGWAVGNVIGVMIATAVLLDIVDEARARRAKLAPAGIVHQIQYLGVIERVLADAAIPCHVHAGNLRTLLAFFGPWAPAIVLVPEEHADAARTKLDDVLRAATSKVPEARIVTLAAAAESPSNPA